MVNSLTFTASKHTTRVVKCSRNDHESPWTCTLYVNGGETVTNIRNVCKTERGARKWADKQLFAQ